MPPLARFSSSVFHCEPGTLEELVTGLTERSGVVEDVFVAAKCVALELVSGAKPLFRGIGVPKFELA